MALARSENWERKPALQGGGAFGDLVDQAAENLFANRIQTIHYTYPRKPFGAKKAVCASRPCHSSRAVTWNYTQAQEKTAKIGI